MMHLPSVGLITLLCFQFGVLMCLFQVKSVHSATLVALPLKTFDYRLAADVSRLRRSLNGHVRQLENSCLEHSEISENTIIRTKDSKALGAKFLNETSLGPNSRDQCLSLCCSFPSCNVAVYEEKEEGNCYLFDCGLPDDFHCKFTSHTHYTSAVIRDNSHEEELTQLKKIPTEAVALPTLTSYLTTTLMPSTTKKLERRCSRFQFECHTTSECIAIYNACDGIPQCSDGSDEAPELGCPVTTTEMTTVRTTVPTTVSRPLFREKVQSFEPEWKTNRDRWSERNRQEGKWIPTNDRWKAEESKGYPNNERHVPYDQIHSDVYLDPDQSHRRYYVNDNPNQRYSQQWDDINTNNEYKPNNGYDRYYDNSNSRVSYDSNYHGNGYRKPEWENDNGNNQQPVQRYHDTKGSNTLGQGTDRTEIEQQYIVPIKTPGQWKQDTNQFYNGEGLYKGRTQFPTTFTTNQVLDQFAITTPAREANLKTGTIVTKASNSSLLMQEQHGVNHANIHQLHVNQVEFQEEKAERARQTAGAIWALALGLSVTAVLVLLVGCRLRSLKRHLRRGRNSYGRDADYLVNGMYL